MILASYNKKASESKQWQDIVSKKKYHLVVASAMLLIDNNVPKLVATAGSRSNASSALTVASKSTTTMPSIQSVEPGGGSNNNKRKTEVMQTELQPLMCQSLANRPRHTPQQVIKAHEACNKMVAAKEAAHAWALSLLNTEGVEEHSAAEVARLASEKFLIEVKGDTLWQQGRVGIAKVGWPSKMPDDELKLISDAIVGWLSIS